MKTINVLFIDAENKEVTKLNVNPSLETWYSLIKCELVESVYYPDGVHFMYVDEEALLKSPSSFFIMDSFTYPVAGNAILMGIDSNGDSKSCDLEPEDVDVKFMDLEDVKKWMFQSR